MKTRILASMAAGLLMLPGMGVASAQFSDVEASNEFAEAVAFMRHEKVVEGYNDGTFRPGNTINRAEFLKVILEAQDGFTLKDGQDCIASYKEQGKSTILSDIPLDQWYSPYVCYGIENDIIDGYPDGSYKPAQSINVPEVAKIVVNTQELGAQPGDAEEQWYMQYMRPLEQNKALPISVKEMAAQVSRGEMVEILYRLKAKRNDKASTSINELLGEVESTLASGTLGDVNSCSELARIMEDNYDYGPVYYLDDRMVEGALDGVSDMEATTGAPAPEAMNEAKASDGGESDYSTTNIQVEGVDEADIVKNDGSHIFIVKDNSVRIVDVRNSELKEGPMVTFEDKNFTPQQLILNQDQLVVIGTSYREVRRDLPGTIEPMYEELGWRIMPPYYWSTTYTKAVIVDIADRDAPEVERVVTIEGYYDDSRRVGDTLYLVLNGEPAWHILREPGHSTKEVLPLLKDSAKGDAFEPVVDCGNVRFFPGYETPRYMSVIAIDLEDASREINRELFLGSSENVYMSKDNLYVATGAVEKGKRYWSYDNTQLYKFALEGTDIEFVDTAKVPGRVLNQYSMDEHNGYFRIATTTDMDWETDEEGANHLYILSPGMDIVGSLKDLAPGERIYSARFMGDRVYIVTFKSVDPLFVISAKDPTNPQVLGYLKIPGFSDYLHPYDENHLIGFGKDVDVEYDEDGNMIELDRLPWNAVRGMKLSLFDVTDVTDPIEKHQVVIGDRGTDSELLRNPKALLFSRDKDLLAFPISIKEVMGEKIVKECEVIDDTEICEEISTYEEIKEVFQGAIVYTVDPDTGFEERGRITHLPIDYFDERPTGGDDEGDYDYSLRWERAINRIIYIGSRLYTISQAAVKASDIMDTETEGMIELK